MAGKGAGIDGERSGLWSEYARIVGELRPKFVFVENVAALLVRGIDRVLGDLAAIGYDAEWQVISAADIGAPHLRRRLWILAYPQGERCGEEGRNSQRYSLRSASGCEALGDPYEPGLEERVLLRGVSAESSRADSREATCLAGKMADAGIGRCGGPKGWKMEQPEGTEAIGTSEMADSSEQQRERWMHWTCGWSREPAEALRDARGGGRQEAWMSIPESLLGRVANGVPFALDIRRVVKYIEKHGSQTEADVAKEAAKDGTDGKLRVLRVYLQVAETSRRLAQANECAGAMSDMPCESRLPQEQMGAWQKDKEALHNMPCMVHAEGFPCPQNMWRQSLPIRLGEVQCWAEMGSRVNRLKALGNAVVPQIPELIARRIFAALARDQR